MPTLQQLNIAQPQPATARLQAMEIGDRFKRTGLLEKQVGLQEEEINLKKLKTHLDVARQYIPQVTQSNYADFVQWNQENGVGKMLKSPEEISQMTPEQFNQYKFQLQTTADDVMKMSLEDLKSRQKMVEEDYKQKNRIELKEEEARIKKENETEKPQSTIGKLQSDLKKAKTTKEKKEIQSKINKEIRDTSGTQSYDKNLLVAAQAVEVDPAKVKSGKLTPEEAIKIAEKYSELFGTQSLIQMLFGGMVGNNPQTTMKFDEQGNLIQTMPGKIGEKIEPTQMPVSPSNEKFYAMPLNQ